MNTLRSIADIISEVQKRGSVRTAVAAPHDVPTMDALLHAVDAGLILPTLFGDGRLICELMNGRHPELEVVDCPEGFVQRAVDAVRDGQCQLLMKGSVPTPALLSACLNKATGINTGSTLCHIVASEIPGWDRLLTISDGGMNILPSIEQKVQIAKNMIRVLHRLGVETPKIALLASVEEVGLKNPATMDAAILTQMNRRGQLKGAIVDGPLALDNILSAEAAKKKHIESAVAGCADGIIVPNIETGNTLL